MLATDGKKLEHSARWFHALADETRLRILTCLTEGEQCVCDLTERLDTAQSRLSFHLKTLKDAGLLLDRREGRWVYYSLNEETMAEIRKWLEAVKGPSLRVRSSTPCCD
jgi:ArsR family transcriptional regulator